MRQIKIRIRACIDLTLLLSHAGRTIQLRFAPNNFDHLSCINHTAHSAERVGQGEGGEVGLVIHRVLCTWWLLVLAVNGPWLAPGGPVMVKMDPPKLVPPGTNFLINKDPPELIFLQNMDSL